MAANPVVGVSSLTIIAPDTYASSLWVSTSGTTPHLYVSTNGNVGIGTANPQRGLHIAGTGNVLLESPVNTDSSVQYLQGAFLRSGLLWRNSSGESAVELINYTAGPLLLKTASAERVRIDLNGNVGISTGAPQARLDLLAGGGAQTDMAQIWRNSAGTIVSSASATGVVMASKFIGDGSGITGVTGATDNTKVLKAGDTMTGQLTLNGSSLTVTGAAGINADKLYLNPNVEISSTTASYYGGVYVSTHAYLAGNIKSAGSGVNYFSGSVGIGITAPAGKLEVAGAVVSGGNGSNLDPANLLDDAIFSSLANSSKFVTGWNREAGGGETDLISNRGAGAVGGFKFYDYTNAGQLNHLVTMRGSGEVGIGTLSPFYRLHVSSGAGETGIVMAVSTGTSNMFWVAGDGAHSLKFFGDGSNITGVPGTLPAGSSGQTLRHDGSVWVANSNIYNNGANVGIGTTAPGASLGVKAYAGDTNALAVSSNSGTALLTVQHGGNVGIGTASPAGKLHVEAGDIYIKDPSNSVVRSLFFVPSDNSQRNYVQGYQTATVANDYLRIGSWTGSVLFTSGNPSAPTERMRVTAAGNVGISTGAPAARLDVLAAGSAQTDMAQIWRNNAGTIVSSVSATGVMMASKFIGDGSGMTGTGDNLGNHTATTDLNMASQAIFNASSITITGTGVTGANPVFTVAGSTLNILANGNVGIGLTNPAQNLAVAGNTFGLGVVTAGATGMIANYTDNTYGTIAFDMVRYGANFKFRKGSAGGPLSLVDINYIGSNAVLNQYDNAGSAVINSLNAAGDSYLTGGNFGIGTNSPATRLQIGDLTVNSANILRLGKYEAATENFLPIIQHKSQMVPGVSNDLALGAQSSGGGILLYTGLTGTENVLGSGSSAIRMSVTAGGNVAIGVTSSTFKTEIYGAGQTVANITDAGNRGDFLALNASGSTAGSGGALAFGNVQSRAANSVGWAAIKGLLYSGVGNTKGDLAFLSRYDVADTALTERLRIAYTGNIGISTGAPQARLDVLAGGSAQTDMAQLWRNSAGTIVSSVSATGVMMASKFIGDGSGMTGTGDNLGNHTATTDLNMASQAIFNASSITITGAGVTGANPIFTVAGSTLSILANGNVGIGTASPQVKLDVADGSIQATSNTSWPVVRIYGPTANTYPPNLILMAGRSAGTAYPQANDLLGIISFRNQNNTQSSSIASYAAEAQSATAAGADIAFGITPNGTTAITERMRIKQDGNVGIGVTNPTNKLEVATTGGSSLQFDTSVAGVVTLKIGGVAVAEIVQ